MASMQCQIVQCCERSEQQSFKVCKSRGVPCSPALRRTEMLEFVKNTWPHRDEHDHHDSRVEGSMRGYYTFTGADGKQRTVHYTDRNRARPVSAI
ncbi:hypothetical protein RR46_07343 [Papilio xuthus]|uniref:Uncharacterized protein n=1 Tax=Papilio xuthus TaxID=66420 RepID=A0A194PW41_PAPXU|nr:hypothetical protein RR46_07343 [Papilio xuthus]